MPWAYLELFHWFKPQIDALLLVKPKNLKKEHLIS